MYFHGMGASPEDSCPFFELAAKQAHALLLCPRGNAGARAWQGAFNERRRSFDEAMKSVPSHAPGTLIGFSIGARMALDVALAEPGKWPSLILMAQKMTIDDKVLDAAGVRRVVLAAGELDGSFATMKVQAERLGARARFVSLGKVGHHFAVDMDTRMAEAVAWVQGS